MSNSIANQTWEMIEQVNASLLQSRKTQQAEEAHAQTTNRISDLQQLEKDVVLPADPHGRQAAVDNAENSESRPQLPYPGAKWNAFQDGDEQTPGLIAIIGSVLALQAKSNSNFWSTIWRQASQSMMIEVKFAPIIGNSIQSAYQAQASATTAQASQSKADGMTNFFMFGGAIAMGTFLDFTDENNPLNKTGKATEEDSETKNAESLSNRPGGNVGSSTRATIDDTTKEINDENQSFEQRAKKTYQGGKSGFSTFQKRATSILGRGMQTAMAMSSLSQGITGWFIDSKYQSQQAYYQGLEGQCQALSKEAEQYSQFYGQDFSRSEDLRQGSGQNIDYAMNILKSAADTITQTVTSMFRG